MEARELRIGNMVQDQIGLEKELIVYKIEEGVITCGDRRFWYPYLIEDLRPIPLTPEILKMAGFEGQRITVNLGIGGYHPQINFFIPDGYDEFRGGTHKQVRYKFNFVLSCFLGKKITEEERECSFHYQINSRTKGVRIEFVHQLQNLYYSLTGEELTINLHAAV